MASSSRDSAPAWALPVGVVALVAIIGFIAWRTYAGTITAGDKPPVPVKPNMFDIKKEAASGQMGNGLKQLNTQAPQGNGN